MFFELFQSVERYYFNSRSLNFEKVIRANNFQSLISFNVTSCYLNFSKVSNAVILIPALWTLKNNSHE